MLQLLAHVKWFVHPSDNAVPSLTGNEWTAAASLVVFGVGLLWLVHAAMDKLGISAYLDRKLGPLAKAIPYIVRYTTGLLLIINVVKGLLFAPNVPISVTPIGWLLSAVLAVAGLLLIIGFKVRLAAVMILAVYAAALLTVHPVIDVLDHVEYIGIGLYLLLFHNQRYEAKVRSLRLANYLSPEALLRVFVGAGLMVLALSEKLVGITNSTYFLQDHHWNFLQALGVGDRNFIIAAGVVEFLVGLTLVLNIAPRVTTAVVALLMTLTAILLGIEEVFGHLFALSLVAVVWLRPNLADAKLRSGRGRRQGRTSAKVA